MTTGKLIIFMTDRDLAEKIRVEKIAKAKGISMAQLSLAWIMRKRVYLSYHIILTFEFS